MFTRVFEREMRDGRIETINASCYGYEYYINNELEDCGLVEDIDELATALIEEGFEEIL